MGCYVCGGRERAADGIGNAVPGCPFAILAPDAFISAGIDCMCGVSAASVTSPFSIASMGVPSDIF